MKAEHTSDERCCFPGIPVPKSRTLYCTSALPARVPSVSQQYGRVFSFRHNTPRVRTSKTRLLTLLSILKAALRQAHGTTNEKKQPMTSSFANTQKLAIDVSRLSFAPKNATQRLKSNTAAESGHTTAITALATTERRLDDSDGCQYHFRSAAAARNASNSFVTLPKRTTALQYSSCPCSITAAGDQLCKLPT